MDRETERTTEAAPVVDASLWILSERIKDAVATAVAANATRTTLILSTVAVDPAAADRAMATPFTMNRELLTVAAETLETAREYDAGAVTEDSRVSDTERTREATPEAATDSATNTTLILPIVADPVEVTLRSSATDFTPTAAQAEEHARES